MERRTSASPTTETPDQDAGARADDLRRCHGEHDPSPEQHDLVLGTGGRPASEPAAAVGRAGRG